MKKEKFTLTELISFGRFIKMTMLSFVLSLSYTSADAQCPLACNDLVHVSMDALCDVTISAEMMLRGQGTTGCTYSVQVLNADGSVRANSPRVTSVDVGKTLTVKVWLGQNSCWGTIKVEDYLPPTFSNCTIVHVLRQ